MRWKKGVFLRMQGVLHIPPRQLQQIIPANPDAFERHVQQVFLSIFIHGEHLARGIQNEDQAGVRISRAVPLQPLLEPYPRFPAQSQPSWQPPGSPRPFASSFRSRP